MPWAGASLQSVQLSLQMGLRPELCSRRAVAPQHSVQLKGQRGLFFRPSFPGLSWEIPAASALDAVFPSHAVEQHLAESMWRSSCGLSRQLQQDRALLRALLLQARPHCGE